MIDLNTGFIQKPEDGLGYSRAFCVGVGKLEALYKGDQVRVWYAGDYRFGRVMNKIPGGCYWVQLNVRLGKTSRVVVNCANFGGRVDD